ncbi:Holliday junction branch migration protein RuvA [candidate division KSB1 bacterium]|nr:Holliday junction branch migration protein RuvA [candidate division KSB1 bacterium]
MISFLRGTLIEKQPTRLIIDVQGVGYEILATIPCTEQIGDIGDNVTVLTHLHVREDIIQLFGFGSQAERSFFQQLITSPGIGPKKALGILSSANIVDLYQYILEENVTALTSLSGIGKKTAQRLVVDLKEKLTTHLDLSAAAGTEKGVPAMGRADEAIMALLSLGYPRAAAQKAVQNITAENASATVEEIIKQALKQL